MTWLTSDQLAGLPGLPASARAARTWLARHGVPRRVRQARGGDNFNQVVGRRIHGVPFRALSG